MKPKNALDDIYQGFLMKQKTKMQQIDKTKTRIQGNLKNNMSKQSIKVRIKRVNTILEEFNLKSFLIFFVSNDLNHSFHSDISHRQEIARDGGGVIHRGLCQSSYRELLWKKKLLGISSMGNYFQENAYAKISWESGAGYHITLAS